MNENIKQGGYYVTLTLEHKACVDHDKLHICPLATKFGGKTIYCSATNEMGEQQDLLKNCPIKKFGEPEVIYPKGQKLNRYIICRDCRTVVHDHLGECPECGTNLEEVSDEPIHP